MKHIKNLATPAEMVEDIIHSPELQCRISADAFYGLLQMAHRQEKAACGKQAETNVKNMVTNSLPQLLGGGQA